MKIIKLLSILLVGVCLLVVTIVVGVRSSRPAYASETTYYLGALERTYNDNGALVNEKVYIGAGNATVVKNRLTEQPSNPLTTTNYLYADHLGSTVLTTKADGTKETTLQYYPYGNSVGAIHELPLQTDKLYTSQRLDSSSDLYFYNARYYNPATGNFISADKAEGPNRYAYVANNPVMRNDPSGEKCIGINCFNKSLQNVFNNFNAGLETPLTFILVEPGDTEYKFMKSQGFWGMTHEDMPSTRKESCYPNCQYYTKEAAAKLAANPKYAQDLMTHEYAHNIQSSNDSELAEHIHGVNNKQSDINKAYQSLLEGYAEAYTREKRGRTTTASYAHYLKNFDEMSVWAKTASEKYNKESAGKTILAENDPLIQFNLAKEGNWNAFNQLLKIYAEYNKGNSAVSQLIKNVKKH